MDRVFQKFCGSVGRRVRALRLKNRLTQEDMMDHGFDLRHYQRIEAGRSVTLWTIWKLADAFKVSPRAIIPTGDGRTQSSAKQLPSKSVRGTKGRSRLRSPRR